MIKVQLKNTDEVLITNDYMACIFISDGLYLYLLTDQYFITQIAGLGIMQGYCTHSRAFFAKAYVCMLEEGGS